MDQGAEHMIKYAELDQLPRQKPPTRSDALASQERPLAAAATAMLREGREVPMASIARDAGVGIGMLYRNYPTREAFLAALTERTFGPVLERGRSDPIAEAWPTATTPVQQPARESTLTRRQPR